MPFRAPVSEYEFMLRHVVDYDEVAATTKFQDAGLGICLWIRFRMESRFGCIFTGL